MLFWKRTLPLTIAFVLGIAGLVLSYVPHSASQKAIEVISAWDRIIAAFALLLGMYSLIGGHWRRIERREAGWGFSAMVVGGFLAMLLAGLWNSGLGPFVKQDQPALGSYNAVSWLYEFVMKPAGATMFSILAFFIASAAYRTFRARTLPAALLLTAAVVVMIGRVPVGEAISPYFPLVTQWLMDVPNAAVKRAIFVGTGLGLIATSLRIIFGVERAYLGGE